MPRSNAVISSSTPWKLTSMGASPVKSMLSAGHCLMSEVQTLDLSRHLEKLKTAEPLTEFGIVEKIVGSSIESQGPNATVGSVCWLSNGERQFPVEVVGFSEGKVITMPLGKVEGVRQGN